MSRKEWLDRNLPYVRAGICLFAAVAYGGILYGVPLGLDQLKPHMTPEVMESMALSFAEYLGLDQLEEQSSR